MSFEQWDALPPIDIEDEDMIPLFPLEDDDDDLYIDFDDTLPILPLRNTVLFPGVVIPITIGRQRSIQAITHAYRTNKIIGVLSQQKANTEMPTGDDLFKIGTVAKVIRLMKVPDGTTTAIIKGQQRFALKEIVKEQPFLEGKILNLSLPQSSKPKEFLAYVTSIKELAQKIIRLSPNIPEEASFMLKNIEKNTFLLNFIASNLSVKTKDKQAILETNDLIEKSQLILGFMNNELQMLELKDQIESKVRGDLDKQQRDYFLNQQLKTIQDELGGNPQADELKELEKRSKTKKWSEKVQETFEKELKKAKRTNPQMPEYGVTLTYLETLLDLPWEEYTER